MAPSKSLPMDKQKSEKPPEEEKELNEDFARVVEAGYEASLVGQGDDPSIGFVEELERQTEQNRSATFQYQLLDRTRRVWATNILVAINVGVYILQLTQGVHWINPNVRPLLDWGANYAPLTYAGEWWRLITCMFLHGGILHLLMNMYALKMLGDIIERLVGTWSFLVLYFITGIAGSLTSLYWHSSEMVSLGASGAICGIFGVLIGYVFWQRHSFPPVFVKAVRSSIILVIVLNGILGYYIKNVDEAAHVGGTILGVLIGIFLSQPFGRFEKSKARNRAIALGLVGIVGTVLAVKTFPEAPVDVIALQEKRIALKQKNSPFKRELKALDQVRVETFHSVFIKLDNLIKTINQNKETKPEQIEILENDIIAPLNEMLSRFELLEDIPEEHRNSVKDIKKLMRLRLDAFETLLKALKTKNVLEKDLIIRDLNTKWKKAKEFDKSLQESRKKQADD